MSAVETNETNTIAERRVMVPNPPRSPGGRRNRDGHGDRARRHVGVGGRMNLPGIVVRATRGSHTHHTRHRRSRAAFHVQIIALSVIVFVPLCTVLLLLFEGKLTSVISIFVVVSVLLLGFVGVLFVVQSLIVEFWVVTRRFLGDDVPIQLPFMNNENLGQLANRFSLLHRDFGPNDYEELLQLDEGDSGGFGASPEDLLLFPVHRFAKSSDADGVSESCPICLEDFGEGDNLKFLPCMHSFHIACIDRWLLLKAVCPVCLRWIGDANVSV